MLSSHENAHTSGPSSSFGEYTDKDALLRHIAAQLQAHMEDVYGSWSYFGQPSHQKERQAILRRVVGRVIDTVALPRSVSEDDLKDQFFMASTLYASRCAAQPKGDSCLSLPFPLHTITFLAA